MREVKPFDSQTVGKKAQITDMFNDIAPRYDALNHLFSFGIDVVWRKKAIRLLRPINPKRMLDIATGTGDFALMASKLDPDQITAIDISESMLTIARRKIRKRELDHLIEVHLGDGENLHFKDDSFDAITTGFGVRNFGDLVKGLQEMLRVLKPGGKAVIIEFSNPGKFPLKQLYHLYFNYILPVVGRVVSGHQRAYQYLPESVAAFPDGADFLALMESCGFSNCKTHLLSGGIASIYEGECRKEAI